MLHLLPIFFVGLLPPVNDALKPVVAHHLDGYLSHRTAANTRRLLEVDLEPLLAGFRKKPGVHPWIGEHIGKWMHAAVLAWASEDDAGTKERLRAKLDYAAVELIKAQEGDGYLGTYVPEKRFGLYPDADWDVWSHKYCIIGLVAYANATGDKAALDAARRAADLLIATFGPGRRSIVTAGTHVGMAATSVLEPIVQLHRATGEKKYLEFALHVARAYDDPDGPRVLESLLGHGDVARTANGKAYEMLSNCVGLCELYRATEDRRYLDAARRAFESVVAEQLYITGTASHHEHFHAGHDLPNAFSANVGETCVTVTWMQLCEQLLRLTGEAKYGAELERSVYNHLAAAQHPARGDWCYYTSLDGTKPYTGDTCCCLSSGPRGMAMAPSMVMMKASGGGVDTLVVNLFETSEARLELGGAEVRVSLQASMAERATVRVRFALEKAGATGGARFGVRFRVPEWVGLMRTPGAASVEEGGWCTFAPREWKDGEGIEVGFDMAPRMIAGAFGNAGKAAVACGPFVLAFDEALNAHAGPARLLWLTGAKPERVSGPSAFTVSASVVRAPGGDGARVLLVPFADAGTSGGRVAAWLGAPGAFDATKLTARELAVESRSRDGNVGGSIIDDDPASLVVTFDNSRRAEDWFAVEYHAPIDVRRVRFVHGRTFHDGGWFDCSGGPPRVEYRATADGAWQRLGSLDAYPKTTGADAAGLKGGEAFTVALERSVRAAAIRVVGLPAHGDNPQQSFASCAELTVLPD